MVNLAIFTGSTAITATERKRANLAVERCRLLLLFANDGLIPFALKVQNQSPSPFGGSGCVNVYVVKIWKRIYVSGENFQAKVCYVFHFPSALELEIKAASLDADAYMVIIRSIIPFGDIEFLDPRLEYPERNYENDLWRAATEDNETHLLLGKEISLIWMKAIPISERTLLIILGNSTDDSGASINANV